MIWEVFIDGACRKQGDGGIGESACAAVIYKNKKLYAKYARPLGKRTNNQAEFEALITALLMCSMDPDIKDPIIYSDSSVVVNLTLGNWSCRNIGLFPLLFAVQTIQKEYRFRLQQVKRDFVWEPDGMASSCLDILSDKMKRFNPPPSQEDREH